MNKILARMKTTQQQVDNYLEELASNELVARGYEEEIAYWEQLLED